MTTMLYTDKLRRLPGFRSTGYDDIMKVYSAAFDIGGSVTIFRGSYMRDCYILALEALVAETEQLTAKLNQLTVDLDLCECDRVMRGEVGLRLLKERDTAYAALGWQEQPVTS